MPAPSSAADPSPASLPPDDHRVIGREMGVFATDPLAGAGLPLWLPAGAVVRHELEQYAREIALRTGCTPVHTPVLGKRALFERSGHWDKFSDDMFPPMALGGAAAGAEGGDAAGSPDDLVLRPANCPHHALVYRAEPRSHRDLPVRLSELAPMFRAERSGVLSGLSRVRQIDLDDAHVFCRPDQVEQEVAVALDAVLGAFDVLGVVVDHLRLSRRGDPAAHLGDDALWEDAENRLRQALRTLAPVHRRLPVHEAPGEAAFYGPKVDVQVRDARGRLETLGTVQLDFAQPERFDLRYADADGSSRRPVMVHRGTLGAMERMVALLLEVQRGRLPFWLAPVQVGLLPVAARHVDAASRAAAALRQAGVRVEVDADGSLGARIRDARRRRAALLAVVGDAEQRAGLLAVHDPATDQRAEVGSGDLAAAAVRAIGERALRVELPGPTVLAPGMMGR